jgi:DNA-binding NarL/FixJ family response regulator
MDRRGTLEGIDFPIGKTLQKILIVDDHPLSCKGYELILKNGVEEGKLPLFSIKTTNSLQGAYRYLIEEKLSFDIIFLDIRMAPFPEEKMFSGEDLGKIVRNGFPKTRLVVVTSIVDNHRISTIIHSLNPKGFLIKSEISEPVLIESIQQILHGVPFYSPTVLKLIRSQYLSTIKLDMEEKEFLHLMSIGTPSKDIPKHLPWSMSKVEKRKRILREKLQVEYPGVLALVYKAKELGFI